MLKKELVTVVPVVRLPILYQFPLQLASAAVEPEWYAFSLFLVFVMLLVDFYPPFTIP